MRTHINRFMVSALIAWFTINVQAQIQTGIAAMQDALQTFVASDDVMKKDTHWSHNQDQWTFKYVCDGDTMPTPASLAALIDAFNRNAQYTTAYYAHSQKDGVPPFAHLRYSRKDDFFNDISGLYTIGEKDNFNIANFSDNDGQTSYVMKWRIQTFHDRNGLPFCTIDGEVCRFYGNTWCMDKFMQENPWSSKQESVHPVGKEDLSKYETLMTQLKYLSNNYREQRSNKNEKNCDAIAYMVRKTCDSFDGRLTTQQFEDLKNIMEIFLTDTTVKERRAIINKAVRELTKRISEIKLVGKLRHCSFYTGVFVHPDDLKQLDSFYDYGAKYLPPADVKISGIVGKKCKQVKIQQTYPEFKPFAINAHGGKFDFSSSLCLNQVYRVYDDEGHSIVIFADTIPMEIDLLQMTIKGSALNERFAECQRRLALLRPERHKYTEMSSEDEYNPTVIDETGFRQLLTDAHNLQMQFIDENADNLIPVWYIAENYPQMTADELKHSLRKNTAYADHVALQPARQYYEGLQKRLPGMKFHDVVCTDTMGNEHKLSEFIGKGDYVLLHFWSLDMRLGCKLMKQLQKKYAANGLRVIGMSSDSGDRWKEYIKSRKLSFTHLSVAPRKEVFYKQGVRFTRTFDYHPSVLKEYGINALPETILFDPKGRIITSGLAGDALKKKVDSLMKK